VGTLSPTIIMGDTSNFAHVPASRLQSDKAVLVDFWDTWCGPCKLMDPLMDWAEKVRDPRFRQSCLVIRDGLHVVQLHVLDLAPLVFPAIAQEYASTLKVVKCRHDSCPKLIQQFKVSPVSPWAGCWKSWVRLVHSRLIEAH